MSSYDQNDPNTIKIQSKSVNGVIKSDPRINVNNETKLLTYLRKRLDAGKQVRDNQLPRMVGIDRAVSGWMSLSEEDRKRKIKQYVTGVPQATMMNLPIAFVQLDDMMTYFAETFSPGRGMFYQTGKPDEVEAGKEIVALMNNHAVYAGYYRELSLALWSALKYNLSGLTTEWDSELGPSLTEDDAGNVVNETKIVWSGNRVKWCDPYNTLIDPCVNPDMLYKEGEWAASVELRSHYWLAQEVENATYINVEQALESGGSCTYYRHPPTEVKLQNLNRDGNDGGAVNWVNELSDSPGWQHDNMHEIVNITIRLRPSDFGLTANKDTKFEIWRITILNNKKIIGAKRLNNIHNHIPFYFGIINNDGMGKTQKSVAELFDPLQSFASHLMNIHIQATRKRLGGLTFYDPSVIDYSQIPDGEVTARIPIKPSGMGKPISDAIWQDKSDVDTQRTLQDIESVLGLLNMFFPTQASPAAIANIDRAVSNQVTAVQQGSNRRLHKAAALLDITQLSPMRASLYYNILQYQNEPTTVTDNRGRAVVIEPDKLRATDLPFIVGMGLKAIDRMLIADKMQQLIFALIQNPQAAARVDVLKMMDYWSSMIDIDIDFKTFEIPAPVGPDGQPIAPAQQGTGVVPATDPAAVTAPIYG